MKGRKTGGRQTGTPNRVTLTLREQVEAEAGAPLPVLLARIGRQALERSVTPFGGVDRNEVQLAAFALAKAATFVYGRAPQAEEQLTPLLPPVVVVNGIPQLDLDRYPGPIIRMGDAGPAAAEVTSA